MNIVSIRGAITVVENKKEEILKSTKELLIEIEKKNNLHKDNVICILFSSTKDLNAEYPAKAARLLGYNQCGLMCFNEMYVLDNLKKCIRLMLLYQSDFLEQKDVSHVYLKGAKILRPDLST
ncbi:chorismate mutase [Keratinibaculum paraultunense]|uniref:chorismate mutase n=1 Tax=Keratinibaculum paraultunense TaxID=1278232 RepID=A0A4R3KYV0_9FIRM|nr:chorismate mutase [Keratinibaculum paraultunense]QQY80653.1 chorismate mutase [Keratinibaculum paraultunense]TCS91388.1 chorismate mutase [Keratinibaculum paraultunense]